MEFIHILSPQLVLKLLHLYWHTHDFFHLLLGQLFSYDFEFIEPFVVGREMHKFIGDGILRILSRAQSMHHLGLPLPIKLHIIDSANAVFENVVA